MKSASYKCSNRIEVISRFIKGTPYSIEDKIILCTSNSNTALQGVIIFSPVSTHIGHSYLASPVEYSEFHGTITLEN